MVRSPELAICSRVCLDGIGENLSKQIELPHELVQTITLAPAPLPVFPGITFNGNLRDIQVLVFQRRADFFEYGWEVVSQLRAAQGICFLDVGIAADDFHPARDETVFLSAKIIGKQSERADVSHRMSL